MQGTSNDIEMLKKNLRQLNEAANVARVDSTIMSPLSNSIRKLNIDSASSPSQPSHFPSTPLIPAIPLQPDLTQSHSHLITGVTRNLNLLPTSNSGIGTPENVNTSDDEDTPRQMDTEISPADAYMTHIHRRYKVNVPYTHRVDGQTYDMYHKFYATRNPEDSDKIALNHTVTRHLNGFEYGTHTLVDPDYKF